MRITRTKAEMAAHLERLQNTVAKLTLERDSARATSRSFETVAQQRTADLEVVNVRVRGLEHERASALLTVEEQNRDHARDVVQLNNLREDRSHLEESLDAAHDTIAEQSRTIERLTRWLDDWRPQ
jgi:chromosome segregation ATPase